MKFLFLFFPLFLFSKNICDLPFKINGINEVEITKTDDLHKKDLRGLCISQISFKDKNIVWDFLLLWNPSAQKGPVFFLPHDDENTAFDASLYAIKRYGGAMLSVAGKGTRFYKNIDPNSNFKDNLYTKNIFKIIDSFKDESFPYISIHNNKKGYIGDGGSGTVSVNMKSKNIKNFPVKKEDDIGLSDPDNLVYLVGDKPNIDKVRLINSFGINVRYELLDGKNDYSMSNYIFYKLKSPRYINIEAKFDDLKNQKKIIDQLFLII